jgi:threonylcarbamoyladenosine tRNA methylthiotransferase MtaB
MKTFTIKTLGCRLNQAESEAICAAFEKTGYRIVPPSTAADVCIIHTCTVTATAENKCLREARRLRRKNPDALIVLAGCAVETGRQLLERSGADLLAGQKDKFRLPEIIEKLAGARPGQRHTNAVPPPHSPAVEKKASPGICGISNTPHSSSHSQHLPRRTRALLKIQNGCDFRCAYCIVPDTRGRPVSRPFEEVLQDARGMIAAGHREIVITGVNTGLYQTAQGNLIDLLAALAALPDMGRIRLSSIEPTTVEEDLIDLMACTPQICAFLHVPLQSGSNPVLKSMRRRYTAEQFIAFIEYAAKRIPRIGLGTDLICGFPGETEADFAETCSIIDKLPFSNLHVFPFSPRPGTPAAESGLKPVKPGMIKERTAHLMALGAEKRHMYAESFVGKEVEVLIEKAKSGFRTGWTAEYLPAAIPGKTDETGTLINAMVIDCDGDTLICAH